MCARRARPQAVLNAQERTAGAGAGRSRPDGADGGHTARLGCDVTADREGLQVSVPSFRADLEREIDLIEEVARIYGLENIPVTLPARKSGRGGLSRRQTQTAKDRRPARGSGSGAGAELQLHRPEVAGRAQTGRMTTFVARAWSSANPLSAEQSVMRTMLLPGLLGYGAAQCLGQGGAGAHLRDGAGIPAG